MRFYGEAVEALLFRYKNAQNNKYKYFIKNYLLKVQEKLCKYLYEVNGYDEKIISIYELILKYTL